MKCARLHLHERSKLRASPGRVTGSDRPRRYCQKRLVNPAHEEDPRWADLVDKFYCNPSADTTESQGSAVENIQARSDENLFLSVLNIKFDGDIKERKQPKTCFKYKAMHDGKKHRMFVKQVVEEEETNEECSSQLTCYYFDDYVKYILNPEQNALSYEKSTVLVGALNNKTKENKSVQVESRLRGPDLKKYRQIDNILKNNCSGKQMKEFVKEETPDLAPEDTKIAYHKSGKRKCLTISRAQSPETVQVIRVDVVCSYRHGSELSDPDDTRKLTDLDSQTVYNPKIISNVNMKTAHFSNKYLLTNTTKTLDENVSGGAKVTLLCKTFRLSRRSKPNNKQAYVKNQSQK